MGDLNITLLTQFSDNDVCHNSEFSILIERLKQRSYIVISIILMRMVSGEMFRIIYFNLISIRKFKL